MADFIISPYAISYNSIKQALQNYIQNKSEVVNSWKDFYASGAGQTILELDAAVASFYAFHFLIGRRESYLPTAQNYSSVLGGAQALGYNATRGHNLYLQLDVIPNTTQVLPKWLVIGSYSTYDIVLLEPAILNAAEKTTIKCVIGNTLAQQIKVKSSNLQQFTFTAKDVTDDCRLILNETEVPTTHKIKEAVNDTYITLTNTYGAMDAFYLNNGNYKYKADDTLYLVYIESNNIKYSDFNSGSLEMDDTIFDTVQNIVCLEDRLDKEDKEHIRVSAPLAHETNDVVKARKDYVKHLLRNNKTIIDANDKDINPGLIALTYLKPNTAQSSVFTQEEKEQFLKDIEEMCPDGVAEAFIEDPIKIKRTLNINVTSLPDENIGVTIDDDIDTILQEYENKLHPTLDLDQIEHDIEDLTGVKTARIDFGAQEYSTNTKYKLYDIITIPDIIMGSKTETWTMYCASVGATSGRITPDWSSAPNIGDTIIDNNLLWERTNKYVNTISGSWRENSAFDLYTDINVGYTVPPNSTTETEPTWGNTIVVDGNVSFNLVKSYGSILGTRLPNKSYMVDDTKLITKGYDRAIYNIVDTLYKSGAVVPQWDLLTSVGDTIQDNALTWELKYLPWLPKTDYIAGQDVAVHKDNKIYVYTADADGTSGETCVLDGSEHVKEQQDTTTLIQWTLQKTIDNVVDWEKETQYDIDTYTQGDKNFFVVTNTNNRKTSNEEISWVDSDGNWLQRIEDNNIVWELDTYAMSSQIYNSTGMVWRPTYTHEVGDVLIAMTEDDTYIYNVYYTNNTVIKENNLVYTIKGYAGHSGEIEPSWGNENVIDNNIVWTKTNDAGNTQWTANTDYHYGQIITTNSGNYVFTNIVGTSGTGIPNWQAIKNNEVQDNNIIWKRITSTTQLPLGWNEYLELNHTLNIVG